MDEPARHLPPLPPPPPDPDKVKGQVLVDVMCLVLTVATMIAVAVWLTQYRRPGDVASEILVSFLLLVTGIAIVLGGVWMRGQVRALFGVADTRRGEDEDTGEPGPPVPPDLEEDDVSEPTECLKCGMRIPAGMAECLRCGWSYRPSAPSGQAK